MQDLPGGWTADIDGDRAVIAHYEAVHILEWDGAQWAQTFVIDGSCAPIHATDLDLSGDLLAFGQHSSELHFYSGRLLVYRKVGAAWEFVTAIVNDEGYGHFGTSADFMAGELLIGATERIYVYELPDWLSTFCHCDAPPCGNADPVRGCANSTGYGASLSVCGSASASADDLMLTASLLPPGAPGHRHLPLPRARGRRRRTLRARASSRTLKASPRAARSTRARPGTSRPGTATPAARAGAPST